MTPHLYRKPFLTSSFREKEGKTRSFDSFRRLDPVQNGRFVCLFWGNRVSLEKGLFLNRQEYPLFSLPFRPPSTDDGGSVF